MIRVPVENRALLKSASIYRSRRSGPGIALLTALLLLITGCSGVVSQNSTNTPPTQNQTYSISGSVGSGVGGSGATVTLSGAGTGTATADASGNYTFTGLANGTYTVTPTHTGYSFNPVSQNATVSGANVTGLNFTNSVQSAPTFNVSGTISPTAGG